MKLVSAIMPTRGRSEMAMKALADLAFQRYECKEIVILDDESQPSFPNFAESGISQHVIYRRSQLRNIAAKRNEACRLARGEIIMHWDSDDWSDSCRMAEQVSFLEQSGKQVTGYNTLLFHEVSTGRWGRYLGDANYSLGTSLCYYRSFWQSHPFNEQIIDDKRRPVGEDNEFVKRARDEDAFISQDARSMMVARVHSGNTSPKDMGNFSRVVSPDEIPAGYIA